MFIYLWCLPDDEGRRVGEEAKPGTDMVNSKLEELLGKTAIENTQKTMKGMKKKMMWDEEEEEGDQQKGEKKGKVKKHKETHMKRRTEEAAKDLMKCLERKKVKIYRKVK